MALSLNECLGNFLSGGNIKISNSNIWTEKLLPLSYRTYCGVNHCLEDGQIAANFLQIFLQIT